VTVGAADVSAATGTSPTPSPRPSPRQPERGELCGVRARASSPPCPLPSCLVRSRCRRRRTPCSPVNPVPESARRTSPATSPPNKASLATTCITLVETSSEAAAAAIRTQVLAGTPMPAQARASNRLRSRAAAPRRLRRASSRVWADVPVGGISEPLPYQSSGSYVLIQIFPAARPAPIRGSASIHPTAPAPRAARPAPQAALALAARHADVSE